MIARFFRWLGTPIRAARSLFPFSHEGRQTLVYIAFVLAAPVLTLLVKWAMGIAEQAQQWGIFADLSNKIAWGLLIILISFAAFVSIRALKINVKDGTAEMNSRDDAIRDGDQVTLSKDGGDAAP